MVKLGSAFSDNVIQSEHVRSRGGFGESPWWAGAGRALVFATLLCVAFFILSWRLFDLTTIHGLEYRKLSDNNRTRELVIHAPRGLLRDRTGTPLVINVPHNRVVAGGYIEVDYLRQYPYEHALSHVLGYTGELSQSELRSEYYRSRNYVLGDRVGRMGAEEVYNERLRGRDGKEFVEVDASGKILRSLGRQEALPGEDIVLSLDLGIAKVAAAAFPPGEKGAIIVAKPGSGEILALFSSPGYSPSAFSTGMSTAQYQELSSDPDLPMFNRAIGGVYPPGSTFKIVMAIAGLETGAITKDTIFEDNGSITIGPFTFPNWYFIQYGKTEGPVDIVKAIKRSNDIFFYKVGETLGITRLVSWAKKIGLGKPLGIELSGEASGLVPDPAWKDAHFQTPADLEARNNAWYLGDTYHISIGQGYLLTTPLAVNFWTNIVANGGRSCRPTMNKLTSLKEQRNNCTDVGIRPETIALITQGMEEACATGGTGWPLFNFKVKSQKSRLLGGSPKEVTKVKSELLSQASSSALDSELSTLDFISVPVACKTGTAEFGEPMNRTHAWFTSFAPMPDQYIPEDVKKGESYIGGMPELSVTVLVEGAGEGSNVAAPIAKKIFEEWFGR